MEKKHFIPHKESKGRKHKLTSKTMVKTLPEILVEVQALGPIAEDQFEAALAVVVTDLQAFVAANPNPPVTGLVVSINGVTFVPQV